MGRARAERHHLLRLQVARVIGSGPNALAGGILLAENGYAVEVDEAEPLAGGGVRTAELTLPGFRHDLCSAIHPLARASPVFVDLDLGIDWVDPPAPLAHPFDDGSAVTLERSLEKTAAGLGRDGRPYRRLVEPILESWDVALRIVLGPYPPRARDLVRAAPLARSAAAALAPARPVAERSFEAERARALFAGCAGHSMLPLERRPSAAFGLSLLALGHAAGWPFPRGGAQAIADAMLARLERAGGRIETASPVDELPEAAVVLADVMPPELVRIAGSRLPPRYRQALLRYRYGPGAFKLDWALAGPIPWRAEDCRRAATIHLGGTAEEIAASERAVWQGRVSERPFVILAQPSLFDETRAPAGRHTAWAYCHVPNGSPTDVTERIEAQVERFAPGFRDLVLARSAMGPRDLERHNRNLIGGDLNGGAMDLLQVMRRPVLRRNPYRTPLPGLYLCSAATPPGGGVHGMCGYAAALTALRDTRHSPGA